MSTLNLATGNKVTFLSLTQGSILKTIVILLKFSRGILDQLCFLVMLDKKLDVKVFTIPLISLEDTDLN